MCQNDLGKIFQERGGIYPVDDFIVFRESWEKAKSGDKVIHDLSVLRFSCVRVIVVEIAVVLIYVVDK